MLTTGVPSPDRSAREPQCFHDAPSRIPRETSVRLYSPFQVCIWVLQLSNYFFAEPQPQAHSFVRQQSCDCALKGAWRKGFRQKGDIAIGSAGRFIVAGNEQNWNFPSDEYIGYVVS